MNDRKFRWGILGAGIIAHKLAEAVIFDPGSELVAVASRTPGKAETFASEFGIQAAAGYEALVSDSRVDVVYVATTHNFHFENTRLALSHHKPVLVEKPFTVNAEEARQLVQLAQKNDCFLMEAIWVRFLPSMIELKRQIESGQIGRLRHLSLTFGGFAPEQYLGRLTRPDLAGGVTLDMGIYPITFICFVLGELPVEIKAIAQMSGTGVDEIASYQFVFSSGITATVTTSFNLRMKSEAVLYGTHGYVDYPNFQQGKTFTVNIHSGSNDVKECASIECRNHENGFIYQVAEVVRCLRNGAIESTVIPHEESIGIMAVMDEIRAQLNLSYPFEGL